MRKESEESGLPLSFFSLLRTLLRLLQVFRSSISLIPTNASTIKAEVLFHSVSLPRTDLAHLRGNPLKALDNLFGLQELWAFQERAVSAFSSGDDAFVFAATGGGKSLCYQLPAITSSGLTLVISPLVALMRDQADGLRRRGISAAAFAGQQLMDVRERIEIETAARSGELKLLLVSPERLASPSFIAFIKDIPLSLIAIDEAHCLSQWGHDFRKDYLRIPEFLDHFPDVPRMALTATASKSVQNEIVKTLLRPGAHRIFSSADRENIDLHVVERKDDGLEQLNELLQARREKGAAIVYCRTRTQTDNIAKALLAWGHKAASYHAGLDPARRSALQDAFMTSKDGVMVATTAFGMGIDKPDIATVAHLSLPGSLEAYYQEIGRAGRDGRSATAWLAWSTKDIGRAPDADIETGLREAAAMEMVMSYVDAPVCRRNALLNAFGQHLSDGCGHCDLCLSRAEIDDVSEDVRAVLSLVVENDGLIGAGACAEALVGLRTDRVLSAALQGHSMFAHMEGEDSQTSRRLIRQCLGAGLLGIDSHWATLVIEDRGQDVLFDTTPIFMRPVRERRYAQRAVMGDELPQEQREILVRLREVRDDHARRRGVPPQAVLSDARILKILSSGIPPDGVDDRLRLDILQALERATEQSTGPSGFDTGLFG